MLVERAMSVSAWSTAKPKQISDREIAHAAMREE